jgi:hypothetical protein
MQVRTTAALSALPIFHYARETQGSAKPATQPTKPPVFIQAFTDLLTIPLRDVSSTPMGTNMRTSADNSCLHEVTLRLSLTYRVAETERIEK